MAPALYLQIKQHILDGIRERHYQGGRPDPDRGRPVRAVAVSRMTVNKALRNWWRRAGWVHRRSGSFVADRRTESPLLAIRNIADEIAERGSEYSARVIRLQRPGRRRESGGASGPAGWAPIFHSLIVHQADGEPLQLEERFVDAERLPGYGEQDFTQQTPNSYLMDVCPSEMEHVVEAVLPSAGKGGLLQIRVDSPCLLLLHRRTWSGASGLPRQFALPGSRYKLSSKTQLTVNVYTTRFCKAHDILVVFLCLNSKFDAVIGM